MLKNEDGFLCCLGFIARTEFKKADIKKVNLEAGYPEEVKEFRHIDTALVDEDGDSELTLDAANINDDLLTSPQDKEAELKALFKDSPYRLRFIGEYSTNPLASNA